MVTKLKISIVYHVNAFYYIILDEFHQIIAHFKKKGDKNILVINSSGKKYIAMILLLFMCILLMVDF